MRKDGGARVVKALITAGLLGGLVVTGGPLGCGGGAGGGGSKTAATVSKSVASLAVFIVKDRNADSDVYSGGAVKAVQESFARAGYTLVEREGAADVFARVGVSKQQQQALFQVSINGKTAVNYKVSVAVEIVDREGKAIDKAEGSYSSSEGEADQDEVTDIVNKLSGSAALKKYAKDTKAERKERKKRAEAEQKEAAAREASEAERKATEKEQREAKKRAEETLRTATKLEREINEIIRKAEGPVPDDKLSDFRAAIETLKKQSPDDARYYAQLDTTYAIENAWWMPEAKGPAAIGSLLSGDVTTSGVSSGKKLSVNFSAVAGNCYTVLLRYKEPGGNEEIKELTWSARGGNTPLQRYQVAWGPGEYNVKGTHKIVGSCATKNAEVSLTADLVFAGTKNALRYVVIGTPKPKFPLYLATYMSTWTADVCDTDAWAKMWSDPIPGTLVYSDKEPYLLVRTDRAGQTWLDLYTATRTERRARKKELSSAPPKTVKFGTQFRFPGCSKDLANAEGPDSIRYAKCHAQIDAKYKGQWEAAERARDNAVTYSGRRAAEAQLNALDEADARDRETLCAPIEKQIEKKWEATFNKIVDSYTDSPQKSPIDRAGELAAQDNH